MTDQKEQKKISKPGRGAFKAGIIMLGAGAVFAIIGLTSTTVEYVGGRMVETQGTPGILSILLIIAGAIFASLGYLKKR